MVALVDQVMAQVAVDDLGHPGVGLALVMFAGELASALQSAEFGVELPEQLVGIMGNLVDADEAPAGRIPVTITEARRQSRRGHGTSWPSTGHREPPRGLVPTIVPERGAHPWGASSTA